VLSNIDWLIPIFVMTTVFTLSVGPGQAFFSYLLAEKEIKKHKKWFWSYLFYSILFYSEMKTILSRIAQVNELMRQRKWTVTPRT
jgi:hypothetical protein